MMFFKNKPVTDIGLAPEIEHDGLNLAMHESFCEFADIKSMIPTALSNVYEMYVLDTNQTTAQKTAVLEGVLSDAWEKIKSFFKKIAEKLKAWWNAAVKYFQTIFSSNKEFLNKFKDDISGKNGDKFIYTGYEYPGLDIIKKMSSNIKTGEGQALNGFNEMKNKINEASKDPAKLQQLRDKSHETVKEMKKKLDAEFYKSVTEKDGNGGQNKFKDALKKSIRGKSEKEIKGFSKGLKVSEMIDLLENGGELMSEIKDAADAAADAASGYAEEVDKLVSNFKSDVDGAKSNYSTCVSGAAEVAKYHLSYASAAVDVAKNCLSSAISQSSSVLRSFARYKEPTKDSYTPSTGNRTSMLEAFAGGW